ncbi:solute carrier family 22 member 6-A-like [Mytilus edulis]|uniref:solute carrier family 22 member 6-A-like n=1 Tax=Mytilus edulis TaxID=6550 RepID=UPI0039EFE12A
MKELQKFRSNEYLGMSSEVNEYLENVLENIGGCGRFQFFLNFFVLGTKTVVAWSTLMMSFGGVVPDWTCTWNTDSGDKYMPNSTFVKQCSISNSTINPICSSRQFDSSKSTVVSEWNLVCDKDWTVSTITTIQMGGLLVGAIISGQIGDVFGRRITYYLSVIILMIANIVAAFSVNWQMFAALRFCIGLGCGWYLTVFGIFLAELTPAKYRSFVLSFPTWAMGTMSFGLFSWILHDWMHLQIATAVFCVPWMLGFCLIPESYRWLVSNKKINEGHDVMARVAKINHAPIPDKDKFLKIMETWGDVADRRTYSVFDIVKHRKLLKTMLLLSVCWFSCGYGYYTISFGVEQLSGNLYVNMVLLGLMDMTSIFAAPLCNFAGRKWTTLVLFLIGGITGITVGVFQFIDIPNKGQLVNGFALASKVCVATGWYGLWILTSESYPTVVRNVGLGVNNAMARVGAMIAPQLVFASKHIPGISYLLLGGCFFLSAFCILFLKETNKQALQDSLEIVIPPPSTEISVVSPTSTTKQGEREGKTVDENQRL